MCNKLKQMLVVILLLSLSLCALGCQSLSAPMHGDQNELVPTQSGSLINGMSEESLEEEQEQIEATRDLQQLIDDNRVLIKELKDIKTSGSSNDNGALFDIASSWTNALGFDGYRTGKGLAIYPLHFPPDDYYMFQQMIINLNKGAEAFEYNIFFTKNFKEISMDRYSLVLKGVCGVDIAAEELKLAMSVCEEKLETVTQGNQFDYELYNENNVMIKMVAIEDVTTDKYIVICSRYFI
jgi:hypothetical protein